MTGSYTFDESYDEEIVLEDGTTAFLRTVRSGDKRLLQESFSHLSPESRYMRFFGVKSELTKVDLHYLTDIDGVDHFALGAIKRDEQGREEGLGVARFVRIESEPNAAEPAIAVIDEMHGLGIGSALAHRLVEAAEERGIKRFRIEFLVGNERLKELIAAAMDDIPGAKMHIDTDRDTVHAEILLPEVSSDPRRRSKRAMRYLMGDHERRSLVAPDTKAEQKS